MLIDKVMKCAPHTRHLKALATSISSLNGSKSDIFHLFKFHCLSPAECVSIYVFQAMVNNQLDHFSSAMIVDFYILINHFSNRSSSSSYFITMYVEQIDSYLHMLKSFFSFGSDGISSIAVKRSSPDLPLL